MARSDALVAERDFFLPPPRRLGGLRRALRIFVRYPVFPIVIWTTVLLFAFFSPLVAPHDPFTLSLSDRLIPPAWEEGGSTSNLFGTDHLGRDIFSRIVYASRVTVIVVSVTVLATAAIGTFLGMLAGFFGGVVDAVLMRFVDFQIAMPGLLFAVMLATVLQPGLRNVIFIIIFFFWAGFARLVRAEVLSLRERDFVALSRVAGAGWGRIFLRHLFPNVLSTVMVIATLEISSVIVFESSLSFLGLGVVPPTVSWGQMLAEGREYMSVAWWSVAIPGLAIFIVALSGNLFGDWLRDVLDPHLRRAGD
ncbi:MAG: ABC transporter permease [Chloroflexi bacterium]|nr:ABC transporter permease [Chloroflexota bacterium]MDA1003387.1 ABC transporter permease [Chloroflexota bacterium]